MNNTKRIVIKGSEAFRHAGYSCFVYQLESGKWAGNVDGCERTQDFDTRDQAIAATKEDAEWIESVV